MGIAHELLHVDFYYNELQSGDKERLKFVEYNDQERRYQLRPKVKCFELYTNMEEQQVIMGMQPDPVDKAPTECRVAFERGEHLRFSHQGARRLDASGFSKLKEPFALADPLRNGEIAKNDLEVAILMKDEKGIQEIIGSNRGSRQLCLLILDLIGKLRKYSVAHVEIAIRFGVDTRQLGPANMWRIAQVLVNSLHKGYTKATAELFEGLLLLGLFDPIMNSAWPRSLNEVNRLNFRWIHPVIVQSKIKELLERQPGLKNKEPAEKDESAAKRIRGVTTT